MATLSVKHNDHMGAVWPHPLHTIKASPKFTQPVAPRAHDGPPKSSEVSATTVPKARRVPANDSERHVGCFSSIIHGYRRRREPGSVDKPGIRSPTEPSAEQLCRANSTETSVPGKASLVKDAYSQDYGSTHVQAYRYGRRARSNLSSATAKQECGSYIAVETPSRDWRPLEHQDSARSLSKRLDSLSSRSPYDMRHGAVQPQYFCTDRTSTNRQLASNEPLQQNSSQQRISGTTTSSSLSDMRSNATPSASSSTRRKALVDLTPQYQPPPQHRRKGHGYYPEQLGSRKLIDYATSRRKESSITHSLD